MTGPARARPNPCPSCPYRRDAPSGVWAASEYDKLPAYDNPELWMQSSAYFGCHQDDGLVCSGWLGHGDPADLLAVRIGISAETLDPSVLDYTTDVPLFRSGAEAAAHGKAEITAPSEEAKAAAQKIITVRARRGNPVALTPPDPEE